MIPARFKKWLDSYDSSGAALSAAAEPLYAQGLRELRKETHRIFTWLLPAQFAIAINVAVWFSPLAWEGSSSSVHSYLWTAIAIGAILVAGPLIFIRYRPDSATTPHVVAIAQMLFSALLIHLTGGRSETHFHVFGSLAVLAFYL